MKKLLLSLFAALMFLPALAHADENYTQFASALRGYDAVAYQTENKALEGNTNHVVHYNGLTYLFASKANAKKFKADPKKYAPAYKGYCAMGVALGKKLPIDPKAFKVVDGKLYMNVSTTVREKWLKNIAGNIAKADKNWPEIANTHPDKL